MSGISYDSYDLIETVRVRPGVFIGEPTLEGLATFLFGYRFAMDSVGASDEADPEFDGFNDWVSDKFGFGESTAGWANIILAVTLGFSAGDIDWSFLDQTISREAHSESVERFFSLLDEYRSTGL